MPCDYLLCVLLGGGVILHLSRVLFPCRSTLSHLRYLLLFYPPITGLTLPPIHQSQVYAAAYDSMSSLYWNSFANQTSQTSLIMQLALSLAAPPLAKSEGPVPAKDRPRVSDTLVRTIRAAANHTSSGIIGATFVFDVLAATGHGDVILDMLMRDDFPSFGYWISQVRS